MASIYCHCTGIEFEVFVVGNAQDNAIALSEIVGRYPSAHFLLMPMNKGYAFANNEGIRRAMGKYIMILNPDTELVEDDSIKHMLEFAERSAEVGIVGPALIDLNGRRQEAGRPFPSLRDYIYYYFYISKLFGRRTPKVTNAENAVEVDWISGAAMLIKRSCISDIGEMDENIFLYAEDIDLCYRAWQKGWKVVYFPIAHFIHYGGGATIDKEDFARVYHSRLSRLYFFSKHYSVFSQLTLRIAILVEMSLKIAIFYFSRPLFRRTKKFSENLRAYRNIIKLVFVPHQKLTWSKLRITIGR